jgi:hypothetical protein
MAAHNFSFTTFSDIIQTPPHLVIQFIAHQRTANNFWLLQYNASHHCEYYTYLLLSYLSADNYPPEWIIHFPNIQPQFTQWNLTLPELRRFEILQHNIRDLPTLQHWLENNPHIERPFHPTPER